MSIAGRTCLLAGVIWAVALPLPAEDQGGRDRPSIAEREAQRVMNAGLPFAEKMLREHGEFFPFGGVMLTDGKIRTVGAFDDREQPPAEEVLALLLERLQEGASSGDYKAAGIFVNVRLPSPAEDGEKVSAIHVALEHRDGYCVDVFFPYKRVLGLLQMDEPFAAPRVGSVFPACSETPLQE